MNIALIKFVLIRASKYRIKNLIHPVLDNFEKLLPLIRNVVDYIIKVSNRETADLIKVKLEAIIKDSYATLPYVNIWLSHLLQNENFYHLSPSLSSDRIIDIREKALIAKSKKDTTFIKLHKNNVDGLPPWDKRALIFASGILSSDE